LDIFFFCAALSSSVAVFILLHYIPYKDPGIAQLSLAAEIFLCAPISTATVESDFSTMNRILTDLRNRLTTEHLEQLL
jgi:hypothetical protein